MKKFSKENLRKGTMKRMQTEKTRTIGKTCTRAVTIGLCTCMAVLSPCQSIAEVCTGSNAVMATDSNSKYLLKQRSLQTGDLWENWVGDLSFLSGKYGKGTEKEPYQISTKAQLMGLSELAAKGMEIEESEGTYPGDYHGAHFILTRNIDLEGMLWIPIGFYSDEADLLTGEIHPFDGHFNGNGKTISNFKISNENWSEAGLFGALKNAEISNLTVKPGFIISAGENVGILVGKSENSTIREITVSGTVNADGTAGGIAGEILDGTIIENCKADHVAVDTGSEKETYAGGIAGKAAESLIVDCVVNTGDSITARVKGGGYVGGILGFQNDTDIFNVHVMGTIGGNGSQSIGGVTGKYASGKLKVARFEGRIADSGMGSLAREGTFIGTHDTGFHFRYGTENGADAAYLFTDSEEKISAGVCGSGIPDDNRFGYDAHIGFWHKKDNFFTLVQGQNTKSETERYFYEELENGILHVIDSEEYARNMEYTPDHFAPNAVGRPTRGYLLSVLQVDTAANVENYYDVAELTARGESVYSKELNRSSRGAVAAGDIVTVMTAPKNTDIEKYQLDGVPTYTDERGKRVPTTYQTGGFYTFVMPAHDTEVSAEYKKVAANIRLSPEEVIFRVIQERKGDRKNPSITTEVKDGNGKLLARYINGILEEGTKVQEVTVNAIVDKNNDVADSRVLWSIDDSDLFYLKKNSDENAEGYTSESASLELNLQADFFTNLIAKAEKEQKESGYRYKIPDTIYGNGTQGGLAVLTAQTRPAESFEGKTIMANCRIPVTFQIKDKTVIGLEKIQMEQQKLEFTITRKLSGNRRVPTEEWSVTRPKTLNAVFSPESFDKKIVSWEVGDPYVVQMNSNKYEYGSDASAEKDYKTAVVFPEKDAKWIQDIVLMDDHAYEADWKVQRTGNGQKETFISITAVDTLGNRKTETCKVYINFVTDDQTVLYGSGHSGGSSGGSSGSGNRFSSGKLKDENGNWIQDPDGNWYYQKKQYMYHDQWAYIHNPYASKKQNAWFYFGEDGKMQTGWHQESDGGWYYLQTLSDGSQGAMYTGWHMIGEKWYYFGEDGRMYYHAVTPDGYWVNESGEWADHN